MKYFCSEAGRFIALLLNGSNVTVATFEKNVTEMVEVDHTLVLQYKFSPAVPVQPGTTLTVMLTAVDDANEENFRNSTSISSKVLTVQLAIMQLYQCLHTCLHHTYMLTHALFTLHVSWNTLTAPYPHSQCGYGAVSCIASIVE